MAVLKTLAALTHAEALPGRTWQGFIFAGTICIGRDRLETENPKGLTLHENPAEISR
jgi:hypothetical protein